MKLTELVKGQSVILQLLWGDQKIEMNSEVVEIALEGVYVNAYVHNGKPLEFSIGMSHKVVCSLYADDPLTNTRVSWKNLELKTEKKGEKTLYFLKTKAFNRIANQDDRRKHDRLIVRKQAQLCPVNSGEFVDVMVFDISDNGISFYAPKSYNTTSNRFVIKFSDNAGKQVFALKVECEAVRTTQAIGMTFYGCKIVGENKEYLLYGCMKRLEKRKKITDLINGSEQ